MSKALRLVLRRGTTGSLGCLLGFWRRARAVVQVPCRQAAIDCGFAAVRRTLRVGEEASWRRERKVQAIAKGMEQWMMEEGLQQQL